MNKTVRVLLRLKVDNILPDLGWVMTLNLSKDNLLLFRNVSGVDVSRILERVKNLSGAS